jgi:hypothetical protein
MESMTADINELAGRRKSAGTASRSNRLEDDARDGKRENGKAGESQEVHGKPLSVHR